jgi:acyl phosphate:glycerol-3-phosphate acyltransferase
MMMAVVFMACAYLIGSVPFAILVSMALKLPDPRTYGSNNPGATNVLRSGNKQAAVLTLLGDAGKGWLAVWLTQHFMPGQYGVVFLVALAVFLGHLFPVFLRFKGGKGVATALGILLALNVWTGLVALAVWLAVAAIFRYSSLAAMVAAVGASIFALLQVTIPGWYIFATIVMTGLLIWRHVDNIRNLVAGTESKIGSKKMEGQAAEDV